MVSILEAFWPFPKKMAFGCRCPNGRKDPGLLSALTYADETNCCNHFCLDPTSYLPERLAFIAAKGLLYSLRRNDSNTAMNTQTLILKYLRLILLAISVIRVKQKYF